VMVEQLLDFHEREEIGRMHRRVAFHLTEADLRGLKSALRRRRLNIALGQGRHPARCEAGQGLTIPPRLAVVRVVPWERKVLFGRPVPKR
jgi:hypothetical protein